MSDKNLDIDGILDNNDESLSEQKSARNKHSMDEIDELLASLKKNKTEAVIKPEAENESAETEVERIIEDEEETEAEAETQKQTIGSDSDDLKKHFGKMGDDDEEEEEEEDDDEEKSQKPPVRKKAPAASSSRNGKKKGKKSGKKKKKKKRGISFNGSIFGGLILVTIILTVSMLLAVSGLTLGMEFYGIGKDDNMISFNIPEGSSNDDIADLLYENGIIKNKDLFKFAIKLMKPKTIYPGDISLMPSMGYPDIIEEMEKQRDIYETVTITFYEGENLVDIANKLEENNVCDADDFLFEFKKDQGYNFEKYITDNENAFYSREGYCFPDTYEFYVNDTAYNITKILREHFDSKITESMYKKMNARGLTLNETMTLASIVQLEAANVDEMPKIASVFLNRLDDPDTFPMLQTDTTYKYIDNVIKLKAGSDDMIDHYVEYYDTYTMEGLPAGPICNPGIEAINAVLDPADTDYYYFCNNLETGETFYAETLEEHEANQIKAGLVEGVTDDTENAEDGGEDNGEEYNEEYNENY